MIYVLNIFNSFLWWDDIYHLTNFYFDEWEVLGCLSESSCLPKCSVLPPKDVKCFSWTTNCVLSNIADDMLQQIFLSMWAFLCFFYRSKLFALIVNRIEIQFYLNFNSNVLYLSFILSLFVYALRSYVYWISSI